MPVDGDRSDCIKAKELRVLPNELSELWPFYEVVQLLTELELLFERLVFPESGGVHPCAILKAERMCKLGGELAREKAVVGRFHDLFCDEAWIRHACDQHHASGVERLPVRYVCRRAHRAVNALP